MDRRSRLALVPAGEPPEQPLTIHLEGELLPFGLRGERAAASMKSLWLRPGNVDVSVLPYAWNVVTMARNARELGRHVTLVSREDIEIVRGICKYLLISYDIVTTGPPAPPRPKPSLVTLAKAWIKAVRIHQWAKNALIFLPLLSSHRFDEVALIMEAAIAFLAFGLCASSVYIMNDIIDLADDRHHRLKRKRPFASGALPVEAGLAVFPVLLVSAFAVASMLLPPLFTVVLAAYYGLTIAYSLLLKRVVALDVIALAMLYTLRVIAGVVALGLTLTFWLLAFATFLFLSLALAKRFAEIHDAIERGHTGKTRGRDYEPADIVMISSLGAASGYLSVLVLALYIREQATMELYANPEFLWLACPVLLFWITRVWILTQRGQMHEDPVVFAVRDWVSHLSGLVFLLIFLAAS